MTRHPSRRSSRAAHAADAAAVPVSVVPPVLRRNEEGLRGKRLDPSAESNRNDASDRMDGHTIEPSTFTATLRQNVRSPRSATVLEARERLFSIVRGRFEEQF